MLNAVLSLTTDKDVAVWKGLILLISLFIALNLWAPIFAVPLALGQIAGLYYRFIQILQTSAKTKLSFK